MLTKLRETYEQFRLNAPAWINERRKALVPVATGLAALVSLNVLPDNVQKWALAALGFLTVIGVEHTTNVVPVPEEVYDEDDVEQDSEAGGVVIDGTEVSPSSSDEG